MANDLSIRVSVDSKAAVADFKRLTDQIHATEAAARKAGSGFQAMGTAAENTFGRIAARAAQARREIEQMTRASRAPQFGAATGGGYTSGSSAPFLTPGSAAIIGGAAVTAGLTIATTGYSELREQAQAQSFLANAAKQTGQAYAQQATEVAKLRRELGLTTAQATQLQAASLRFTGTIGRPQDAGLLARSLGNALAASGRSSEEIPERLRQLQTGQDELFDVLGPVKIGKTTAGSPEQIYKAYAKEILNVKRELTDLEKIQARYYAVVQAGEASIGAASERMKSDVGKIDLLTNSLKDLAASYVLAASKSQAFQSGLSGAQWLAGGAEGNGIGARIVTAATDAFTLGGLPAIAQNFNNYYSGPKRGAGWQRADLGTGMYQSILGPAYSGALDTPTYLNRDPFASGITTNAQMRLQAQENLKQLSASAMGFAGGLASTYSGIVGAGDILAHLNGGESPSQRAARIFSASGDITSDAAAAYRISGYSADEARIFAEADARRFRISSLGNVAPGELSADQEAAYREDLAKFQEDQLKETRRQLEEAIKANKLLAKIAGKLAPDEPVDEQPITIQLDNRTDAVARFELIANGDSLRGFGPRGDQ